jgi:adenylate kinase family enzyme
MLTLPPLDSLGTRICLFGPSNSGKSTLAEALSDKLGIPAVHLDRLHHLPNTDWEPRPREEFEALQRQAIATDNWVMDGNYGPLFPERLARATGAIVLDDNHWLRLGRYFRRTLFERQRAGTLEGNKDSIKWEMIHWVAFASRHNGERYRQLIDQAGLPHVYCHSMRDVKRLYDGWQLQRRTLTSPPA